MSRARYEIIGSIKRLCPLCSHKESKSKQVYHLRDILTGGQIWACKECIIQFPLNLKPKDQERINAELQKEHDQKEHEMSR